MAAALHRIPRDVFVRHVVAEMEQDAYTYSNSFWARTLSSLARTCRWTAGVVDASRTRELYRQHTMRYVDRIVDGWHAMGALGASFCVGYGGVLWAKFDANTDAGTECYLVVITHRNVETVMVERYQLRAHYGDCESPSTYVIPSCETFRAALCDTLVYVLAGAPPEILCARHMRIILLDEAICGRRRVRILYDGHWLCVKPRSWDCKRSSVYCAWRPSFTAIKQNGDRRTYALNKLRAVVHET